MLNLIAVDYGMEFTTGCNRRRFAHLRICPGLLGFLPNGDPSDTR